MAVFIAWEGDFIKSNARQLELFPRDIHLTLNQSNLQVRFFCTLALSILVFKCFSQKLLFYKNSRREVSYEAGEILTFDLKGDGSKIRAQIKGFEGNLVVFQNFKVSPGEVANIYVDDKTRTWFIFRYKYQRVLPLIGLGYMLLDFINTGSLSKETVVFGSTLIAAGLLAKIFISEKIKIKGRRKLVIIR
jgi:hypothetical protein